MVDGRIKEVWKDKGEIVLYFSHPVSREEEELVLKVDGGTGFNRGLRWEDLKKGTPVTVDYHEDEKGNARAVRVSEVLLSGVPIEKNPFLR